MGQTAATMSTELHRDKVMTVVGLGKTGLSCARFLSVHGYPVTVMDSRSQPPGLAYLQTALPDIDVVLGEFDSALMSQASCLVVSPGVAISSPAIVEAIKQGVEVIGDIELFARYAQAPVIAITGSNGKSTVTTLLGEMAKCAGKTALLGGNIGTPALDLLVEPTPDFYVLELSSFQLETTSSLNAIAAVVLNLSQDHLDRYDSMAEYAEAKRRIFNGQGTVVINLDDPVVRDWAILGRNCVGFSLNEPVIDTQFGLRYSDGLEYLAHGQDLLMPVQDMKMTGRHNIANALASLALGYEAKLPMAAMLDALASFVGLPHRCQWVAKSAGVNWYNDSKATNVGAAVAAIDGMSCPVVLIAGGQAKEQSFAELAVVVKQKCRAVVLIGQDADVLATALADTVVLVRANSMSEAVVRAAEIAQAGDAVLLAPACASFDMFNGYEDRGNRFISAIREVTDEC